MLVLWTSDIGQTDKLDAPLPVTGKEQSVRYRMMLVATELLVHLHGNDEYDLSACWKAVSTLATDFLKNKVCLCVFR